MRTGAATLVLTTSSPELTPVWKELGAMLTHAVAVNEAGTTFHNPWDLGSTPGHPRNTEGVEATELEEVGVD